MWCCFVYCWFPRDYEKSKLQQDITDVTIADCDVTVVPNAVTRYEQYAASRDIPTGVIML